MRKKKYIMKEDEAYYEELSTEYDRQQMADYTFKKRTDVEGKNMTRLRRYKVIKIVLCVVGAFLIMSVGYFITATVRNVNSYHETTSAQTVSSSAVQDITSSQQTEIVTDSTSQ